MRPQLFCREEARREIVRRTSVNGIDYLEVLASRRTLLVHCFRSVQELDESTVAIEGGVRVRNVRAMWAYPADDLPAGLLRSDEQAIVDGLEFAPRTLVVRTDSSGDFSTYTLRLVTSEAAGDDPAPGFDPVLSSVEFSFKVDCETDFDCAPPEPCEEPEPPTPQIDYLAKDYSSFRRLIFDRLSIVMPEWRERNPADVWVTLVELLAYVGDYVSYYQDAVATEAYLGTARRRASIRRHARLVDYRMHDGCNARTWVSFEVGENGDGARLPARTKVLTGEAGGDAKVRLADVPRAVSDGAVVFETMHALTLRHAHNRIPIYTWGDDDCCVPAGATRLTLLRQAGVELHLEAGDVLVLEEVTVVDRVSGSRHDADPQHRHAVRLKSRPVAATDPATGDRVVEVEWHDEDALLFPLRVRRFPDPAAPSDPLRVQYSVVARGNVALADHGYTAVRARGGLAREFLGEPTSGRRFRPTLNRRPLTHARPYHDPGARLAAAGASTPVGVPEDALPAMFVLGDGERWEPIRELLAADRFATNFVAEMDEDGTATLRFGDDVLGRRPRERRKFDAVYRIGNGAAGNVGADALSRVATTEAIERVTNPIAARGGIDPEPLERVRLYAPQAFRSQRRAVTEADYVAVAERHPEVQKAGATRRWTGSWYTMFVTVDRVGGRAIDADFEARMGAYLESFRLAGYDVEIDAPQFVALELALTVCVKSGYLRSSVKEALLEALGNRDVGRGRRGFFHPDNFTFGDSVYVSRIVAAAMAVPGVAYVEVTELRRFREVASGAVAAGSLELGRLEIARLDNDPNFPEHGRIRLELKGGL